MRLLILSLLLVAGLTLLPPNRDRSARTPALSDPELVANAPFSRGNVSAPEETPAAFEEQKKTPVETSFSQGTSAVAAIDGPSNNSSSNHLAANGKASSMANAVESLKEYLVRSLHEMEKIPAYTAVLEQQVQKRGRLLDPDWIDLKLRRSPFSVYLKWQDDGQEVVYVEGLNDGRLLAHPTKGLASLRSVWKLRPESQQAMRDFRYPLTEIGIENLSRMALRFYQQEKSVQAGVVCVSSQVLAEGRPATQFDVSFANENVSPVYATSRLIFSQETGFLISVESHGWNADGKPGMLLELYRYHKITPNADLGDLDFSEDNPAYGFHK